MKIKEINYQVCRNLGNYETVRYSVTCILEDGEKPNFEPLKKAIDRQHDKLYKKHEQSTASKGLCDYAVREITNIENDYKHKLAACEDEFSEFMLVVKALKEGRRTMDEVLEVYDFTPDAYDYFKKHNIQ